MKKLILKKIILEIGLLVIVFIAMGSCNVKAVIQANTNTQYVKTDTPANWMKAFREIEGEGLATDLSPSGASNNIDIHMMKTTEYGAIAILSASGYGNSSNDKAITSTTGNCTGIIINIDGKWEWTAGGLKGSIFSGINKRYYDEYESTNASAKRGDALGNATTANPGCAGWHKASFSSWVTSSGPYFLRGGGGIFSFSNGGASGSIYCRGVAVCGAGL